MPEGREIRRMFAAISSRYDLLNSLLSLGRDRLWRRRAAEAVAASLGPGGPDGPAGARRRVLDLCCGTGDLALELAAAGLGVTGADFCHEMLVLGRKKAAESRSRAVGFAESDALRLPFAAASFDAAAVAFGVRNLEDLDAGLREIARVLRPGGLIAVLEFGRPRGALLAPAYRFYLRVLVPLVGRIVSGRGGAYGYLSASIREFPDQAAFPSRLARAGFEEVVCEDLTGGIAALYVGRRPAVGSPSPGRPALSLPSRGS